MRLAHWTAEERTGVIACLGRAGRPSSRPASAAGSQRRTRNGCATKARCRTESAGTGRTCAAAQVWERDTAFPCATAAFPCASATVRRKTDAFACGAAAGFGWSTDESTCAAGARTTDTEAEACCVGIVDAPAESLLRATDREFSSCAAAREGLAHSESTPPALCRPVPSWRHAVSHTLQCSAC